MDTKSITQILQLYMMNNITSVNTDTDVAQSSNSQSKEMFNLMLQEMLNSAIDEDSSNNISQQTDVGININNLKMDNNIGSYNNSSSGDSKNEINSIIEKTAQKYGLDGDFIKAIVGQESSFNPDSVSEAGAMGLMQLMPKTSESLGVKNPFDVLENIDGGTRYIKQLIDSFGGNKELALSAYNGGISRMNKRGVDSVEEINKMPKETQNYVEKVMKKYESYKKD